MPPIIVILIMFLALMFLASGYADYAKKQHGSKQSKPHERENPFDKSPTGTNHNAEKRKSYEMKNDKKENNDTDRYDNLDQDEEDFWAQYDFDPDEYIKKQKNKKK